MVLRGAHEHPGAVAVEDEQGRMLNLAKLSLQVWQFAPAYADLCINRANAQLTILANHSRLLRL